MVNQFDLLIVFLLSDDKANVKNIIQKYYIILYKLNNKLK